MFFLFAFLLVPPQSAHAMFFPNGDFEKGDLSHWFVQEDFSDVASSPLVKAVDDGTGNHVGALFTTSAGVKTATLGRDIGTMPAAAQDLFFDYRLFDVGPDDGGVMTASIPSLSSSFLDSFTISLLTDSGDLNPILTADNAGFTVIDPSLTSVNLLSNGFYHVNTDVSGLRGANNSKLFFDLADENDGRLTKAWVDNADITVTPEPTTIMLLSCGLMGLMRLRKKEV